MELNELKTLLSSGLWKYEDNIEHFQFERIEIDNNRLKGIILKKLNIPPYTSEPEAFTVTINAGIAIMSTMAFSGHLQDFKMILSKEMLKLYVLLVSKKFDEKETYSLIKDKQ